MKTARVLRFGPPSVITNDDLPQPDPAPGQLLVRVKAAGVGNWDALIREGRVKLQPLPLTLGAELSGIVETIGANVSGFQVGDEVYGTTNAQFSGAYAEYAVPVATMMAPKPRTLSFIEAASAPIVAVTAWQMLFDYARVTAEQTVLIHGAAGNVARTRYNWPSTLAFMSSRPPPPTTGTSSEVWVPGELWTIRGSDSRTR
jgi:NADPH:quinone reductase-like Zn-dependent oxidoreductase